ncbi:MAG TPA: hypothetical protein VEG30_06195 [Terriglobales bacterium]|nr:hypothetical protein [Terriglobales bacterium]
MTDQQSAFGARRCAHIFASGAQCLNPVQRGQNYCHFHAQSRQPENTPGHGHYEPPTLETPHDIQLALVELTRAVLNNQMDYKRCRLALDAYKLALLNLRSFKLVTVPHPLAEATPAFLKQYHESVRATAPDLPPPQTPQLADASDEPPALPSTEPSELPV